jgi:uncharacterized membrane protein YfcA
MVIFKRLHAVVLTGVAIWCFVTALAGGLVGLVLGNIRLPVLLFAAAAPAPAAGANLAISGIAAAAASVTHVRAGRVDWRLVRWLTPPSVAGAVGGGFLATAVPANALRIVIGSTLLLFGLDTLRVRGTPSRVSRSGLDLRAAVLAGLAIGFLGGLIGLILGTLRMPALLRWVGEDPSRAIGTNLVVGIAVGAAGLVGHLPGGIDWTLLAVGAGASIPGALLGSRLTGRLSTPQLLRAVGAILLVAGVATILQGVG